MRYLSGSVVPDWRGYIQLRNIEFCVLFDNMTDIIHGRFREFYFLKEDVWYEDSSAVISRT